MDKGMGTERPRVFDPSQATPGLVPPRPGWDATELRGDGGEGLANYLGWLSIGVGLAEALAPERLAEALGMEDRTDLIRAFGVRGIVKGMGILAQRHPTPWLWARVAGDALDLATLATHLGPDNPKRGNVAAAVAAVSGMAVLDVMCATQLRRSA